MSQRFLFLLRLQPGLDNRRGASTEAGGGVSVKRQSVENTEMAKPAQGQQQGRELSAVLEVTRSASMRIEVSIPYFCAFISVIY